MTSCTVQLKIMTKVDSFFYLSPQGELCKYAIGCHLGALTKDTKLWDNTGVFPMQMMDPIWNTVDL